MSNHPADEDLLGLIDRELAAARSTEVAGHVQDCSACIARYRLLTEASGDSTTVWRQSGPRATDPALRERLHEAMTAAIARRHARRVSIAVGLTAALLFLTARYESALVGHSLDTKAQEKAALPVASFTPGAAQDVGVSEVCRRRRIAPAIPESVRLQVLRDYGMERVPEEEYELDYLITPELGGIPDRRNLWPERYAARSWNAHAKDALEQVLPQLVCDGRIDLATAQREIATNWIMAYKKYLVTERPVQLHARVLPPAWGPLAIHLSY